MKLNPTTRAVRSALAISATMLALSGGGTALAGTCAVTGPNEVTCNGVFTDDVTNTVPIIDLLPDLTLVVGTDGSTTVDPGFGSPGISSYWGGDATVISYAEIHTDGGDGITMYSDDTATVQNYGEIYAYASLSGVRGIDVVARNDVTVVNEGVVGDQSNFYTAVGIDAYSLDGDVSVTNDGLVYAISQYGNSLGIFATNNETVYVSSTGEVQSYSASGSAWGIAVSALHDVEVVNSGTIAAYGAAAAAGIDARGLADADVYVGNSGSIYVGAGSSSANGIFASAVTTGDVYILNTGYVYAIGDNFSTGLNGHAVNGDVSIVNEGELVVYSDAHSASGIRGSTTGTGSVSLDNSGTITASSYSFGIGIYGNALGTGDVYATNSGAINATGANYAIGINLNSHGGDISTVNSGSVDVYALGFAYGLESDSYGATGDVSVSNHGYVTAYTVYGHSVGAHASVAGGDFYLYNDQSLSATSMFGAAYGVDATVSGVGADATVVNVGSIYAGSVYNVAAGVFLVSNQGTVGVDNSGTIGATSQYGVAAGVLALAYSDIDVTNSGDINASSYVLTNGIYAISTVGDVNVDNSGSIDVYAGAYGYYAYGIHVGANYPYSNVHVGQGDIDIDNSGTVTVASYVGDVADYAFRSYYAGSAYGIWAGSRGNGPGTGNVTVSNSGLVDVTAKAYSFYSAPSAMGIYADSAYGHVVVDNSGTINVFAEGINVIGGPSATGIQAYSEFGDVDVTNSGLISVGAQEDWLAFGSEPTATGVYALGIYGNITVNNSGTISATSSSTYGDLHYGNATAIGVNALGFYGGVDADNVPYGVVTVNNTGTISADATSASGSTYTVAYATGVLATGYSSAYVVVNNDGLIDATASTGDDTYYSSAIAHGVVASAFYGAYQPLEVNNSGTIRATASAGSGYANDNQASAYGVTASNYANIEIYNTGSIIADASAGGAYGYSDAVGVDAIIAPVPYGYGTIYVTNDGSISATADNQAIGVRARTDAYTGIYIYNNGTISASAGDTATGLSLQSGYYTFVYNTGLISATGAGDDVAIDTSVGTSGGTILNYGTITGALWMGAYDDYLYNGYGSVWNVGQTPTDFGAGDDGIYNAGTINMDDSVIHMGTYSVYGNYFNNSYYGTINVNGDSWIDMGGPQALVPSLNPLPFYNYGTIDFTDGAADDTLLITGDFAGQGYVNVDVSGLNGTSDQLYVDGSVVSGTVQTINVDLLDLSNAITGVVPMAMVYVSGDSVADNFELGDVTWDEDNSFVTLGFSLIADIDETNAEPDAWRLGIEMTGLSDVGTLAASIPGAVQSLANSSVGTWRQRMGVIDSFNKGAISLWARVWQDKGSWDVDHHADNFGQGGNFNWDQKNSGIEGGIDFAVTDEFSLGLLVGKSKADTDLDDPGTGHSDIDADTWGVYGTWISPTGFYLDASYRWMSFDVDLHSTAGKMSFSDNAEVFNVELGYAWTLASGLKIEPQFQYTKTNLDSFDALVTSSGMVFTNDGGESTHLRLGVSFRKDFGEADAGWLWTPYLAISAVRENDGENLYSINDVFHGETDIGGTSTLLELGFNARHQNWAIYGGLNWQDGGAVNSFFGGQLGVRYTFGGPAPVVAPPPPPPQKTCADLDDDGDGVNNCDDKCLGSTAGQAVGPDGCPVPEEPAPEPKPFRG